MNKFCRKDITIYLQFFAKNMGIWLELDNELIVCIADQIEARVGMNEPNNSDIPKPPLFEQILHVVCKKCKLRYIERGTVTKKEYTYCIRTDDASDNIPCGCPMIGKKSKVCIENVQDDQDIIDIRKRSKLL